jgi:hydrogenase expression/formation protein HypE
MSFPSVSPSWPNSRHWRAVMTRAFGADCTAVRWRSLPQGCDAQIIGTVEAGRPQVVLETELGGERIIEELEDEPLPCIC